MMRQLFTVFSLIILTVPLYAHKILFDYTKDETAGNADWIPDRDFPMPLPQTPRSETDWDGAISAFAVEIAKSLHDTVFILHGYPITYNDSTNPYDLSNFDVFIIPEPQNPFTQREKEVIKKFVKNGGGLFLISDHNSSDRNHSGWDSPRVFNDLGSTELFGMHFNTSGEPDNYFTYTSQNIHEFQPITNGPFGHVTSLAFHGGTSISLRENYNQNVKGLIFKNDDNTGCMFAISTFGKGKIAGIGDSSPLDDGTGDPHDILYNGWEEEGDSHKNLFMNTLVWLLDHPDIPDSFVLDGEIDSAAEYIGGNGNLDLYISRIDTFVYIGLRFSSPGNKTLYILVSSSPADSVAVPWGREGYMGNYDFYISYSTANSTFNMRDSRNLPFNSNINYAANDSTLEFILPVNIITSDTIFLFTGIFSPASFKMETAYPSIEYINGTIHYSYKRIDLNAITTNTPLKPPIISQGFVPYGAFSGEPVILYTRVFDNGRVDNVKMYYSLNLSDFYLLLPDSIEDSKYHFSIPAQQNVCNISYYFTATDNDGLTSISDTYSINVVKFPFSVYFEEDTLTNLLSRFVDSTQHSIDICMYEVFNQEVVNALISAHQRGVRVRIITDSSYYDRDGITSLINAGIPVIHEGIGTNSTNHIMHNKFIIKDFYDSDTLNDILWTGSFNASSEKHVDNVITIKNHSICALFEEEFNQMWGGEEIEPDTQNARTGRRKNRILTNHTVNIGESPVSVYFSPQDSSIQYIIDLVNSARKSIHYLIFSFTRDDLKNALITAHSRGVEVKGVHEDNTRDDVRLNTVFNDLRSAGCSVYWAQVPYGYTFLHDKIMIIDSEYVVTGSMNWTGSANDENDENILIIKNRKVASLYLNKFNEVYEYSRRPTIDATPSENKINRSKILYYSMLKNIAGLYNIFTIAGQRLESSDNISRGIYFLKDKRTKSVKKIIIVH